MAGAEWLRPNVGQHKQHKLDQIGLGTMKLGNGTVVSLRRHWERQGDMYMTLHLRGTQPFDDKFYAERAALCFRMAGKQGVR